MRPDALGSLEDILEAIVHIEADTAGLVYESFCQDRHARQLVERNISIISEAVSRLRRVDPGTAEQIPQSHQIIGIRNRLAHGYEEEIDNRIIRDAVQKSILTLHLQVANLIPEFEE